MPLPTKETEQPEFRHSYVLGEFMSTIAVTDENGQVWLLNIETKKLEKLLAP